MSQVYKYIFLSVFLLALIIFPRTISAATVESMKINGSSAYPVASKIELNKTESITVEAEGTGFETFVLQIGNREVSFVGNRTVTFTVNKDSCKQVNGRPGGFSPIKQFGCTIINPETQQWSVIAVIQNIGTEDIYHAQISPASNPQGYLVKGEFTIGTAPVETLKVSLEPSGPLPNNQNHRITISWSPVSTGQKFYVLTNSTTRLALPGIVTCEVDPCTSETNLPAYLPGGTIVFTVIEEGNSANKGSATIAIEAVVPPDVRKAGLQQCQADETCTLSGGQPCDLKTAKPKVDGEGVMTAIGCVPTKPQAFVEGIIKFISFAAGGVAFLLMILGALQMITAEGNPENIKNAQEKFYSAIIGLLFVIFAVLLLQVIGYDILGLPGFSR